MISRCSIEEVTAVKEAFVHVYGSDSVSQGD